MSYHRRCYTQGVAKWFTILIPSSGGWTAREAPPGARFWLVPSERWNRHLTILQAFVDESGLGDALAFTMVGLVAPTSQWVAFADAWKAVLDEPPKIKMFKTDHANRLDKSFKGISREVADTKIAKLKRVIEQNVSFGVCCIMQPGISRRVLENRVSVSLSNDYFHLAANMFNQVFFFMERIGISNKVSFIFDQTSPGIRDELLEYWHRMKQSNDPANREIFGKRMGGDPRWETDDEFPPLQASDMVAGAHRRSLRKVVESGAIDDAAAMASIGGPLMIPFRYFHITPSDLDELGRFLESSRPPGYFETGRDRSQRRIPFLRALSKPSNG